MLSIPSFLPPSRAMSDSNGKRNRNRNNANYAPLSTDGDAPAADGASDPAMPRQQPLRRGLVGRIAIGCPGLSLDVMFYRFDSLQTDRAACRPLRMPAGDGVH
jgi:hypothetical protein